MKKIISLFKRCYDGNRQVYNEVVPGAEWVINGEGIATIKFDGTSCLIKDGVLYKRYDVKEGKEPPYGFIPAQEPDKVTGHWPGWLEVGNGNEDKWHREGFESLKDKMDGTYELVGSKVQRNPYHLVKHELWKHGASLALECPRDFESLKEYLNLHPIEGIVWHHPDGKMAKIKARDFGLKWPRRDK